MENGKGYITDKTELIEKVVTSHMRPLITCVLEGQERNLRKLDEVLSMMKMTRDNRLLIWILGTVDLITIGTLLLFLQ